jgi:superoxide dismutase, Fe-Mn family
MNELLSRRCILTKVFPAVALAGVGLTGINVLAQEKSPQGVPGAKRGQEESGAVVQKLVAQSYDGGEYRLPKLPYEYNALEPHINAKVMQIHHDKHHQGYVDGLNKTIKNLSDLRAAKDIDSARLFGLQKNLSFNGGGHLLHTLFWATMTPEAAGKPQGEIAEAINNDFNSFDTFKNYFSKVATDVKGSGWALLAYEPIADKLLVFQIGDHDLKLSPGIQPLLPLDVWEHAYYLQYENERAKFVDAWWNVVNWSAVNESYNWFRSHFREEQEK